LRFGASIYISRADRLQFRWLTLVIVERANKAEGEVGTRSRTENVKETMEVFLFEPKKGS